MQLQSIPTASIRPNDYNPNVVTKKVMTTLKGAITRDGYIQPIIVRNDPADATKFIVVDGEHRFEILSGLGYAEIPCVVVAVDEDYAKVQTINMNKIRGDHDRIKMAELIVKLKQKYTEAELEEMLGFEKQDLRSYEDLAGFDLSKMGDRTDEINALDEKMKGTAELPTTTDFSIAVTPEQLRIIEAALHSKKGSRQDALVAICHEYNLA